MKKQILLVLLVPALAIIGCQRTNSDKTKGHQVAEKAVLEEKEPADSVHAQRGCSTEQAMKLILALEEVEDRKRNLDSLTAHKGNISFLIDSLSQGGKELYSLTVGYNNTERFEPYYHFYLNKDDCKGLQIMDVISGEYLPLTQWRKQKIE